MKISTYLKIAIALIGPISPAWAQTITGKVIDAKYSKPLYHANIRLNSKGTLTDKQGNFQLSLTEYNIINKHKISVSFVGYKTQEFSIGAFNKPLLVQLEENTKDLNEVIVSSSARGLVEDAIRKIPENYPNHPFIIRGIITEKNKQKRDENLYELKAIVSGKIPAYQDNNKEIDTKIEALEKRSPYLLDTISYVKWGGTGKVIEYFDFVKQGIPCINIKKTKKYNYFIQDIVQRDGRPTYKINVNKLNKKNELIGNIYIDQESLAFESFDFFNNLEDSTNKKSFISKIINQSYITQYKLVQSKWYLSEIKVGIEEVYRSVPTYISVNFFATEYDSTNISNLRYQEKYQGVELLSSRKNTIGTDSLWLAVKLKVLPEHSDYINFEPIITKTDSENSTLRKSVIPFNKLPVTSFNYGLSTNVLTAQFRPEFNSNLINLPIGVKIPLEKFQTTEYIPKLYVGIGINVLKKLQVEIANIFGIATINNILPSIQFYTVKYDFKFNKSHRPFTISPIFTYGNHITKIKLDQITSSSQQNEILGLNDDKLNVSIESAINTFSLGLQFGIELNRAKYLQLGVNYNMPGSNQRENWIFRETKGFLFHKEKSIANDQLLYQYNNSFSVSLTYKKSSYAK
jgi:hypothetical protein